MATPEPIVFKPEEPATLWSRSPSRCLTLRSSGPPPAWHLAREAMQCIIRLAGQAPRQWCPLSSNVRPHRKCKEVDGEFRVALQGQCLPEPGASLQRLANWLVFVKLQVALQRSVRFGTEGGERMNRPDFQLSVLHAQAARPLAGSSPSQACEQTAGKSQTQVQALRRNALGVWSKVRVSATVGAPGDGAHFHVAAEHRQKVRPNPSLERTSTGMALGPRGYAGHHPPRGPSTKPVVSAQLKR
jgi:hypothetical protein